MGMERWVGRLAGDLGPGVLCERCLEAWVLPRARSPLDDDRDKADAGSSSGPSAADPVWSADPVRSRPGLELIPRFLLFHFLLAHWSVTIKSTPTDQSPGSVGPEVAHRTTVEPVTTTAINTRRMIIVVSF